jgi:hypothetical protein
MSSQSLNYDRIASESGSRLWNCSLAGSPSTGQPTTVWPRPVGRHAAPGESLKRRPGVGARLGGPASLQQPAVQPGLLRRLVAEAARLLCPGGVLAVLTGDPHSGPEMWYAYQYFEGVYETDRQRFPTQKTIGEWMIAAGLEGVETRVVEHRDDPKYGRAVLDDPFLKKNATSQLALLSEAAYRVGLEKLEHALVEAEARGETLVFRSEWSAHMITAHKPSL